MIRRTLLAATGLAVAFAPLPAGAATPPVRMQVWEVVRTSSAPSNFAVSASVGYVNSRAIIAMTYLRHTRSGIKVLPGANLSGDEGSSEPQVYNGGKRVSCTSATGVACTSTKGVMLTTAYYRDNGLSDAIAPDTVLVVTYGRDGQVAVSQTAAGKPQWRVRKVSRAARAFWSSDANDTTGVWSKYLGAEVFTTKATLKGGRRGSVAIAAPPCAGTAVGTTSGLGSAKLTGGVAPVETSCPEDVMRPSQVARKATTWTFSGSVAGLTADQVSEPGTVRLLVVDL